MFQIWVTVWVCQISLSLVCALSSRIFVDVLCHLIHRLSYLWYMDMFRCYRNTELIQIKGCDRWFSEQRWTWVLLQNTPKITSVNMILLCHRCINVDSIEITTDTLTKSDSHQLWCTCQIFYIEMGHNKTFLENMMITYCKYITGFTCNTSSICCQYTYTTMLSYTCILTTS